MRYFVSTNHINDMKPQIELHEATYTRNGIKVNYVLFDEAGEAIVSTVIPFASLETYIVDEGLNELFFNPLDGDCEYIHADTYLEENLNDVVTAYLAANLEGVAA